MMRAIVTGATGMIGWNLIQYLVKQNMEVLALVNPGSSRKDCIIKNPCVTIKECDLDELEQIELDDDPYDYFFHLGWKGTHGAGREDMYIQEENVRNSLCAVDLAAKAGCKVFVGSGSQAEYGSSYAEKLNDSLWPHPQTSYGIGKYMAGIMTRKRCQQLKIRHEWVRILSVYGPGDGLHTMVMSGIIKMLQGETAQYTRGEQQWDYLYVEDAVEALYRVACNGQDGKTYCLGSGRTRKLRDYIKDIQEVVNPTAQVQIGALEYPEGQVMYLCADTTELENDTGFRSHTPFKKGIAQTVNWIREKGIYEKD